MLPDQEVVKNLDYIIKKYEKMPDAVFMVFEAYTEKVYNDISYSFEVRDFDEKLKSQSCSEDDRIKATGITEYSSQLSPGRKYTILTGREIAERARRILSFVSAGYLQPPGLIAGGTAHFGFDVKGFSLGRKDNNLQTDALIKCDHAASCVFTAHCPRSPQNKLTALRYGGTRAADTRALQTALFKIGYADEMFYEKYRDDGLYGLRTRLAAAAFITELNYLEGKKLEPENGEYINGDTAEALSQKCGSNWERKRYYHLRDARWDLKNNSQADELSWLRYRCHVRQLQEDMRYFIMAEGSSPWAGPGTEDSETPLYQLWQPGIFDAFTEKAVIRFQEAAGKGARFGPLHGRLVYSLQTPTFKGSVNGQADVETKREIERWFEFAESSVKLKNFAIKDYGSPPVDFSSMEIVLPALTHACLTREKGTVEMVVSVPAAAGGETITPAAIKANLAYFLFLHRPAVPEKPFLPDTYLPSRLMEDAYEVQQVEELEEGKCELRFYRGTTDLDIEAPYIDSRDEDHLKRSLDGTAIQAFNEELILKFRAVYDRKYPGFFDAMKKRDRTVFKVVLKMADDIKEGMYLLKVRGSKDLKPHPLRVFGERPLYNIVHLTDIHLAARYDLVANYFSEGTERYNNPNERLRDFIRSIKTGEIGADMVVITGDAVDYANNHRPYESHKGEYVFKSVYDRDTNWRLLHYMLTTDPGINVPVYICPGNHDFRHNAPSVQQYSTDLNISTENADQYPYDKHDTLYVKQVLFKWWMEKCLGDSLYADENALQYYYEYFCPLTDYSIILDDLNLIFMNTGTDHMIYIAEYGLNNAAETASYVQRVLAKDLPAPMTRGFDQAQLEWLQKNLDKNAGRAAVLCMHNPLVSPPGEFMARGGEVKIDNCRDCRESSLANGREEILKLVEDGRFKLLLTGHTHTNAELKCLRKGDAPEWFCGSYSEEGQDDTALNATGQTLVLSTLSGGVLGFRYVYDPGHFLNETVIKVRKRYYAVGYRLVKMTPAGGIKSFKPGYLWRI